MSNAKLKLSKNQANDKQHRKAELSLSTLFNHVIIQKVLYILRNKQKNKRICIHDITQLIIMKVKRKMKKRKKKSHRCVLNSQKSRYEYKYSNYKKSLAMMMYILIKQQLSKIWSLIHEKVKQHWGWIEKKGCL